RNFAGSHIDGTGFKAEGFKLARPRAASFTVWGFGEAARLAEVACFDEATCAGDLLCFDEASLTSIGRSTNAAIAAMTGRQRGTPRPKGANFLPDDGNPCFPRMTFVRASWQPR